MRISLKSYSTAAKILNVLGGGEIVVHLSDGLRQLRVAPLWSAPQLQHHGTQHTTPRNSKFLYNRNQMLKIWLLNHSDGVGLK